MNEAQQTLIILTIVALASTAAAANFSGPGKHIKRVLLLVVDALIILHISGAINIVSLALKAVEAF